METAMIALVIFVVVLSGSLWAQPAGSGIGCKRTALGNTYAGRLSRTISGKTCQAWASQSPHSHDQKAEGVPEITLEASSNFCRNPDNYHDGPWCYTTDSNVRWELCDVPMCLECKQTLLGDDYQGQISQTASGRDCQRWDSQWPHEHSQQEEKFPEKSFSAAHNYCRNPSDYFNGLWCYTTDSSVRWELCDVPMCQECMHTTMGKDYQGEISHTINGKQCQAWDSQNPHQHSFSLDASNYCRNPSDYFGGPWCYTTNPNVRWEVCDIPMCGGAAEC